MLLSVNVTQTEIGALFPDEHGKPHSQSWVSRTADLVNLPGQVQGYLEDGRLSKSHGEELLSLRKWPRELVDLARQAVDGEWSSNALQANVRTLKARLEKRDQLDLEVPEPPQARTVTTETTTETTVTTETVSAPEPVTADHPPVEAQNAEEAQTVAGAPAQPKSGALKSAEEKVAERIAQRDDAPAKPSAWEGKTQLVIGNEFAERLAKTGRPVDYALSVFCELSEFTDTFEGLTPDAGVDLLKQFLNVCCEHELDPELALASVALCAGSSGTEDESDAA